MRGVLLFVGGMVCGAALWALLSPRWTAREPTKIAPAVSPATGKKPPPPRARRRSGAASEPSDAPPPQLTAADLEMVTQGDSLTLKPQSVDLGGNDDGRTLSRSEIDEGVRGGADGLVDCIRDATGDAQLKGRVMVGMVVSAQGSVTRSRVEAPAYLIKRGAASCLRRQLARLSFPATGRETVVRVPLDID